MICSWWIMISRGEAEREQGTDGQLDNADGLQVATGQ